MRISDWSSDVCSSDLLGHRNLLGIAFDKAGNLWTHEMGPRGGDEFNLVRKGENYGWPKVSEGRHYGGTPIPAHSTDPQFIPPKVSWTPVISPAGLVRSEERRVGKEGVSTCRSRWSPYQ